MYIKFSLTLFLVFQILSGNTQNLIANSDFSDRNVCKEMNASCGPEAWFMTSNAVPIGKNMAGITVFNSSKKDLRQYLQTELLMELKKDSIYEIKVSVLAGECIVNSLGIKFSEGVTCVENDKLITNPDVDFSSQMNGLSKGKQKKWIDLTYNYKAKGGERFIVLGCFVSDRQQNRRFKDKVTQYTNYNYFFRKVEVNATYLDELPTECDKVKQYLYNFNYRHTFCMYKPYVDYSPILVADKSDNIENIPLVDSLILDEVLFDFNSSDLKEGVQDYLNSLFELKDMSQIKSIEIIGYTDNIGDAIYNVDLSLKRANAIKQYFVVNGWSQIEIKTKGLGETNPIADNATEEGRAKNRRIEIIFTH